MTLTTLFHEAMASIKKPPRRLSSLSASRKPSFRSTNQQHSEAWETAQLQPANKPKTIWSFDENGVLHLHFHPGQTRTWLSEARFTFMLAGTQGGKALALDTIIPTPYGTRMMGDLHVGDIIFDEHGSPTSVTYVSPVYFYHRCFRLCFDDGTTVVADADHLWPIMVIPDNNCPLMPTRIITTQELAEKISSPHHSHMYAVPAPFAPRRYRTITTVYAVPTVPVRCISVNAPSHLYLCTSSYLATHNTTYGPWWLYREILRCGGADYLAVTSNYDLFKLKMLPVLRETFEHVLGIGRFWAGSGVIELCDLSDGPTYGQFLADRSDGRMWGRIILRSARSESGLESSTAAAAWIDEGGQSDFTLSTWQAILRRLSLYRGRVLVTTTIYEENWLKYEAYDRWQAGDPDYNIIQFDSATNPSFPREEQEKRRQTMQDYRFAMFYLGQFSTPPARIYPFSRNIHVVSFDNLSQTDFPIPHDIPCSPHRIPWNWKRWVGIDFGAVNTAIVWVVYNPIDERYYVYREMLEGGKITAEYAFLIKSYWWQDPEESPTYLQSMMNEYRIQDMYFYKENVVGFWGGSPSEEQARMDWQAAGIPVYRPPIKDIRAGIDRVTALFKQDKIRVFDTCQRIIWEFEHYSRKVDDQGNVIDSINDQHTYHMLDALRYVVSGILDNEIQYGAPVYD